MGIVKRLLSRNYHMSERQPTRRRYLLGLGALGAVGLAGCTSDSGPGEETESDLFGDATDTPAATATHTAQETPTATAQETPADSGESRPDFGGYLDSANNYNGNVVDATGQSEASVAVGAGDGLAFGPPAVHVDNGATVRWEWTGEGGAHNVVAEDGTFDSGSPMSSGTFEYTFESDGIYNYYCAPHKAIGMLGAVVVGNQYPRWQEEDEHDNPAGRYLSSANNYDGEVVDGREYSEVVVEVGAGNGLAFDPAALHVRPGTTIRWEWTGEGGAHNIIAEDGPFDSGSPVSSGTYEYTVEDAGIYRYYCAPHEAAGMKGALLVGDNYSPVYSDEAPPAGGGGGGTVRPDLQGYLDDAQNYDGDIVDRRGQAETSVAVGAGNGLAFGPPAIHVDNGATVTWEWTGEGGAHSVVETNGQFDSGEVVGEAGHTYSHRFTTDGIYPYYCEPHQAIGMLGVVVVGTDYPRQ
jgi:halocyanin-like protein